MVGARPLVVALRTERFILEIYVIIFKTVFLKWAASKLMEVFCLSRCYVKLFDGSPRCS